MSKVAIVYGSVHHSNTKKLVDAIASQFEVDVIDATKKEEKNLQEYDVIGIASGIYGGSFHQSVLEFIKKQLPADKKVFILYTSAMPTDFSKSVKKLVEEKNATVIGSFGCRGFNTFGPFKLVGGTSKGHPDEADIADVLSFFKGLGI